MATAGSYPANTFALEYLADACRRSGLRSIVEVGVGHGTAVDVLDGAGLEVTGFDRDPAMVEVSRAAMAAIGRDPGRVSLGDIEDPSSYAQVRDAGPFDALLGLGILPTARDEAQALANMRSLVRPGGEVFVEYRNVLFSLVTFNRHTRDFLLDDLLNGVDPRMRDAVADYVAPRLDLDRPPLPTSAVVPKYHNPLTVAAEFERLGFVDATPFYFHYHPGMPALETDDPDLFHEEARRLEHEDSGWKGMFLCSAFLVHARVPEE
jgi:SAM-dependent methyltransferase